MKVGEYPEAEALGRKLASVLDVEQQAELPAEVNYLRIEALRAASRVVAGTFELAAGSDPTARNITHATLVCAAQFHRWLKDG